ncbi:GFA family protein [Ralstonia flatus]|nr:GFA family protein [Ralstonia sp. LMG 32965]MBN6209323.1 GFA family protein [Ralstonia pickettii]
MPAPYPGSCLCGSVKFQLLSDPLTFYVCHCTMCQRRSGGAALPVMWVHRTDLQILEGEAPLAEFNLGNGHTRRARICPRCDTRLWAEPLNRPNIALLRPGTLENQQAFTPVAHVYTRSKQPWFLIPPGVAQFETYPEQAEELVRLWRQATSTLRK